MFWSGDFLENSNVVDLLWNIRQIMKTVGSLGISGFQDFIHRVVFEGTRRFGN
jgi:hypothetical protein